MVREFSAGRFVSRCSERDDFLAQLWLAGCKVRPLPSITAGPCAGQGPMRAPDSGDDTLLRVVTRTTESIKGRVAGPSEFLSAFLLVVPVRSLLLVPARPALLLTPPSPPIHLLAPPKVPPSCLMRPILWIDAQLHEVPQSRRRRASCQGGIAQWSIPQNILGGAVGQSCKVLRDC